MGYVYPQLVLLWKTFLVGLLFLFPALAGAQESGSVAGLVVSSWDGTALPTVVVTVRGTTLAVQTGPDGRYLLKNVPPGDHILRFSKSGFTAATVTDVHVLPGQTTTVNGNLRPEFFEMEEYEVTAEEFVQQTEKILFERQKAAGMMEALGSDYLSRVGAGNAAESISKVSGATIVDGKSAVIRGLNDRYVTTTLNGASIPSADPYRQSASLDLFPAQVIDRVNVAKTFTPDQPGTFTGGGIDIITKSFPEKTFVSLSLGAAYNSQASLNDRFLTYSGGGYDWAAIDDGKRALPAGLENGASPWHQNTGRPTLPAYQQNLSESLDLDAETRALGATEFAPRREAQPLNHNFSVVGGGTQNLMDGLLGYFAGINYKHDYNFYENGISRRYQQGNQLKNSYRDTRAISLVNWAGMVNLAYRPFENHQLGFTFFYNQNATDEARIQDQGFEESEPSATFRKFNLYWTERNLNTYQMKGEHLFPTLGRSKFDWLLALTQTTQDEPNARFFNDIDFGNGPETGLNGIPNPSNPTRYYRTLDENNRNAKVDWTVPFENWTEQEGLVKFGLFDSYSERTFQDNAFSYFGGGSYSGNPNDYLHPNGLGIGSSNVTSTGNILFNWNRYVVSFTSRYGGRAGIQAGYFMSELPLVEKLRLVGGLRYETTDLRVRSESYLASSVTGERTNDSRILQSDVLPSVGLIYSITSNMNVRVNYSQTIARPSFREMAAYYSYDTVISEFVEGNPELKMSSINNYDIRWEWFPRPGEVFGVSLFYKDLKNAIERGDLKVDGTTVTFLNRDKAKLYGIEFEARKNLDLISEALSPFSIGGNLSLIKSEVRLTSDELAAKRQFFPDLKPTRSLYDQSPYILNLDLNYTRPQSGTSASLIYNIVGPRIAITKLNADDVYEQPAPTLDFVVGQKLREHLSVKFFVKNLLNPRIERTYGEDGDRKYSSYTRGRLFGVTLNYDF